MLKPSTAAVPIGDAGPYGGMRLAGARGRAAIRAGTRLFTREWSAMEDADPRLTALAYLASHNTLTLATVGPDGPWGAGLFYVNDEFTLYWLSDPMARHSQNIARDRRVAVTVHEDYRDWRVIQGLQMEGTAEQVGRVADGGRPVDLYVVKYPFLGTLRTLTATLRAALEAARVYRFTATRILLIDNTKGFGHRRLIEIAGSRIGE